MYLFALHLGNRFYGGLQSRCEGPIYTPPPSPPLPPPHLLFLGLYNQNLVKTTFIPEEIFDVIIFKQVTDFLD